jgi:hypothetical protein
MSTDEGADSPGPGKRANQKRDSSDRFNLTPNARLDAMTRERVMALDEDKKRLLAQVERLQDRLDQLGPENSRIEEALRHAESSSAFAAIVVTAGGVLASFSGFEGKWAPLLAHVGIGLSVSGVALMWWQRRGNTTVRS